MKYMINAFKTAKETRDTMFTTMEIHRLLTKMDKELNDVANDPEKTKVIKAMYVEILSDNYGYSLMGAIQMIRLWNKSKKWFTPTLGIPKRV